MSASVRGARLLVPPRIKQNNTTIPKIEKKQTRSLWTLQPWLVSLELSLLRFGSEFPYETAVNYAA